MHPIEDPKVISSSIAAGVAEPWTLKSSPKHCSDTSTAHWTRGVQSPGDNSTKHPNISQRILIQHQPGSLRRSSDAPKDEPCDYRRFPNLCIKDFSETVYCQSSSIYSSICATKVRLRKPQAQQYLGNTDSTHNDSEAYDSIELVAYVQEVGIDCMVGKPQTCTTRPESLSLGELVVKLSSSLESGVRCLFTLSIIS